MVYINSIDMSIYFIFALFNTLILIILLFLNEYSIKREIKEQFKKYNKK